MKGHQADKFVTSDTRVLRVYAIEGGRVVGPAQKCDYCGRPVYYRGHRWVHGIERGITLVPRCYVSISYGASGIYNACPHEAVDGRHLCEKHLDMGRGMEPRPWNPADDGIEEGS